MTNTLFDSEINTLRQSAENYERQVESQEKRLARSKASLQAYRDELSALEKKRDEYLAGEAARQEKERARELSETPPDPASYPPIRDVTVDKFPYPKGVIVRWECDEHPYDIQVKYYWNRKVQFQGYSDRGSHVLVFGSDAPGIEEAPQFTAWIRGRWRWKRQDGSLKVIRGEWAKSDFYCIKGDGVALVRRRPNEK